MACETSLDEALSHQATLAQAKVLKSWAHYEQAQSLLESAITRSPDMPGRALGLITAEIADCLHHSGQFRAAQQYFSRAAAYAQKDRDHKAQIYIMRQHAETLRILNHTAEAESLLKDALQKATHTNLESERRAILYQWCPPLWPKAISIILQTFSNKPLTLTPKALRTTIA